MTRVNASAHSGTRTSRLLYLGAVLIVVTLAAGLRLFAADRLAVDYDEPVYLRDAVYYAGYMRTGDFKMLAWSQITYEHPALYKILYGVVLLTQQPLDRLPDKDLLRLTPIASAAAGPWNIAARHLSVLWGTLAVLALALVNPPAGLFLGIDTLSVKYTSEVYLEALPLLTSLLCVLAYARWYTFASLPGGRVRNVWIWLVVSAALLGMTAAGKYVYSIVGVAILLHFVIEVLRGKLARTWIPALAVWAIGSIMIFVAFGPSCSMSNSRTPDLCLCTTTPGGNPCAGFRRSRPIMILARRPPSSSTWTSSSSCLPSLACLAFSCGGGSSSTGSLLGWRFCFCGPQNGRNIR